jgi:SAM-dependent methyltransferase
MANENTIREFLVSLGFDVDQQSHHKFIGTIGAATAEVNKLGLAVEAAVLLILGFTTEIAKGLENLYWESQRTHTSVENIRAFTFAMSNLGVTAGEAHGALEALASFQRTHLGSEGFLRSILGSGYEFKDTAQTLLDLGKAFATMTPQLAIAYGTRLGLSERMVTQLRNEGDEAQRYEDLVHDAYKRIGYDADAGAKTSLKFMDALRGVWSAGLEPLIENIATSLMPGLTIDMDKLRELLLDNSGAIQQVVEQVVHGILWIGEQIITAAEDVTEFARDFIRWFGELDEPSRRLTKWIIGISAVLILLNRNPFMLIIGGIVALIEDFENWKKGADHFINWDVWAPEIKHVLDEFDHFATWLDTLVNGTVKWQGVLEGLAIFMGGKWLLGMILPIGKVLEALSLIPGSGVASGVTSAILGAIGISGGTALGIGAGVAAIGALAYVVPNIVTGGHAGEVRPGIHPSAGGRGRIASSGHGHASTDEQQSTSNWLMQYFIDHGKSREEAAAIVGNFTGESSLDPYATNKSGHAGLGQWDTTRRASFEAIYEHAVNDPRVPRQQLMQEQAEFILHELATTHAQAGKHMTEAAKSFGPAAASDVFGSEVEIYGNHPDEAAKRRGLTMDALNQYNATPPPPVTSQISGNSGVGAAATAAPNITNNQTINNTIHTNDVSGAEAALDRTSSRANADLVRQTRSALV